ncbi:MAG: YdcF family protein [Sphingomonadales bacterium]|nr:YdcF family protein [Sphingomonadales bacterium]
MLRRALSLILLVWVLGFIVFAVTLPAPFDGATAPDKAASGVVVLTGAEGRIARGLYVLRRGWAGRMLVAGVDPEVDRASFMQHYHVPPALMACCIVLGTESVDTRSNALEARRWIVALRIASVRLVTSDWHIRRAAWELRQVLPPAIVVTEDAVRTRPSFNILFIEYCKLSAQRALAVRRWLRDRLARVVHAA